MVFTVIHNAHTSLSLNFEDLMMKGSVPLQIQLYCGMITISQIVIPHRYRIFSKIVLDFQFQKLYNDRRK